MPDDFAVPERATIDQAGINRQLSEMLGRLAGIATGNIANEGQTAVGDGATAAESIRTAVGDGAMAAESILYTTFNIGQKRQSWRGVVPREHLDRLTATYAPGPSDAGLAEALARRHVIYLSARPGWGRYAAAQVALAARHSRDRVMMIHIAPGERIVEAVDDASYLAGHGHIVDATDAHPIGVMDLLSIDQRARDRQATVIVVGPPADRGHDLGSYLFTHRRATAVAVFRRQLAYLLEERGKCLGSCAECRLDCVPAYVDTYVSRPALRKHLNETTALEEAAKIAVTIGGAAPGADPDALLAEILDRQLRAQARFVLRAAPDESHTDRETWSGTADYRRAFRIAYAALEGAPMAAVYAAAARLFQIPRDERPEAAPEPDPVEFELDCLLSYGMRAPGREQLPAGAPRTARLANAALVPALLEVAWNERGLGPRLMRWLDELAADPHPVVRSRAGLMAGLLSFFDFDAVMAGLVTPWARSRRMRPRQAAGLSLLSCAHNPALWPRLRRQITHWMDDGTVYTRDAVAWAYAYGLGRELPYEGLGHLHRIGRNAWQRRSFLVAIGVEQTYAGEHAAELLDELRTWLRANDDGRRLQVHAARAFVRLARRETLVAGEPWPELLVRPHHGDAADDSRRRPSPRPSAGMRRPSTRSSAAAGQLDGVADLWHAALSLPATAASAWQAFTTWYVQAERVPELAEHLLDLLRILARDPHLRTRLRHQLDHVWRRQRPPGPLLTAAAAIIERV